MPLDKILVTGATGFIGKNLAKDKSFNSLFRPIYTSRNNQTHTLDLGNYAATLSLIKETKSDQALLLAWQGLPDYSTETCLLNLNNQLSLIKNLIDNNCKKIILAGSCWQYGDLQGKLKEGAPSGPTNFFAETKNNIFDHAKKMAVNSECIIIDARIFFVYGEGQRQTSLIPANIASLTSTGKCEVRNPEAANDFIHVSDVVNAFVKILQNNFDASTTVNIGSGKSTSVKEIINIICEKLKKELPFDKHYKSNGMWANNDKLKKMGWSLATNIEAGLAQLINGHSQK